jgi:S1-C subfamily serine protease
MSRPAARVVVALGLLALAPPAAGQDPKPTRVEVGKRGKAATAFAEVPGRGTGTAFCVHPSGLFVTNEHVIRGGEADRVILVLNPSLPTQRVLKARPVRVDKDADLALLQVEGAGDFPSLPLGSVSGVSELADVVACGFPLGFALAPDRREYPAISVNAGTVTSLRRKTGELQFIQVDVALTFGNSGGPVLDEYGKVIGVVVSGVAGGRAGINLAIPVNRLEQFLRAPEVSLVPPELTREGLERPVEFKARVASFLPGAPEPSLTLVLRDGTGRPREVPMAKRAGLWVATAAPVVRDGPPRLGLSARFPAGALSGQVDDLALTVAGRPTRLSAVRRIEFNPRPVAHLDDGRTAEAEAAGLRAVDVDLGGQRVRLDLTRAAEVTVQPPAEVAAVTATVVATADGKEVARAEARLAVRGAGPAAAAAGPPGDFRAHAPEGGRQEVLLTDAVADVALGGGGRYLILRLAGGRKLAVFDAQQGKVVRYLPLAEETPHVAAGASRLVAVYPGAKLIQTWSLATFEKEKAVLLPDALTRDAIHQVCMGYASDGPLFVYLPREKRTLALDLATAQAAEVRWTHWGPGNAYGPLVMRVSGDGSLLAGRGGGWAGCDVAVFEGSRQVRNLENIPFWDASNAAALPNADGRFVFASGRIVNRAAAESEWEGGKDAYVVPAVEPGFCLSLQGAGRVGQQSRPGQAPSAVAVYTEGRQKLFFLTGLDEVVADPLPWERRIFYYPTAGLLVTLGREKDRLILRRVDLSAELDRSGADYLVVVSRPPAAAAPGKRLEYAVRVKSKKGGVRYKLEAGPEGMSVGADGTLTWDAPAGFNKPESVALTISDASGQEVLHRFELAPAAPDK